MSVALTWEQIAVRILLAAVASFLIGYNRDERGKALGIRTTMLVCLAATLAMVQANQLMATTGKTPDSFVVLDLMRLPLGILSGIGFIGAGAILRKDGLVHGVTTAATMWFVTVLGLIFGGGQLRLGVVSTALALFILWGLKRVEMQMPTHRIGLLSIQFTPVEDVDGAALPTEAELRQRFQSSGYTIKEWTVHYTATELHSVECELEWSQRGRVQPETPELMRNLAALPFVTLLNWRG
jgi:putative Mg2+ transporter-C (MgtC) family protein